ncbi:MAG: putative nucleotidyltransferase substrate binding domain-containing protein [Corynebacterium sp.]|uniref:putative nucleotidyltransferase substrate binding domain-containing protein n=1 Tax=Corynebacterium sp. TaxID=1720 RepID=UPI0026DD3DE5|nr:putative nucleotidyltransferase substrate binding domain-containing protein [Corynebacterium sp.]MDO4760483.1 putative nucleotidyltransferase substrate binding domain-containing protein [Corynebacterium sp.]
MTVELDEVRDFLAAAEPFSHLPEDELKALPSHMGMVYVRRGETIIGFGEANDKCFVIRSGAVDVLDEEGTLLDRRESGRAFGYSTLMGDNQLRYSMVAVEDSLLLTLPREAFLAVANKYEDFARFFSSQSKRMNAAAHSLRTDSSNDILRTKLSEFMITTPATIHPEASIQQAAVVMQEKNVSSLLITSDDGQLAGIITDRDLRKKVVAVNLDVSRLVSEIMTSNLRTATSDSHAFEAMIAMSELGIHHLPVVDNGKLVGIVSSPDIMRLLRNDPIYVTADLSRKSTIEELAEVFSSADDVAVRFIERGATPEEVAGLLTVAADSLARRILTLAEEKFGAPPIPYAFVVVGSQGRRGMGLASDQDNALVLDDAYDEAVHGDYFRQLGDYVCTSLDAAGQVLCPGDMMASNPEWRKTESQWIETFRGWISAPEPDALLHAQTFFDFRAIYGDEALAERVHLAACEMAQHAGRMHAHLATLAARREPPLGFFRGFVVDRGGEYANTLDVKKGGTAAIVQMARLFALSSGVTAVSTRERLVQAGGKGAVSVKGAQDLIDAFDFLNVIALQQQAEQVRRGEAPTYHIDPNVLSKMDREHLRDAFQIIKNMQTALATKYPVRSI